MARRAGPASSGSVTTARGRFRRGPRTPSSGRPGSTGRDGSSDVIDLPYSLVIEATDDPTFFGFYSPDLEGFTGVGHSVEDCLYKARWGMREHVEVLREQHLPVPPASPDPLVTIRNQVPSAAP